MEVCFWHPSHFMETKFKTFSHPEIPNQRALLLLTARGTVLDLNQRFFLGGSFLCNPKLLHIIRDFIQISPRQWHLTPFYIYIRTENDYDTIIRWWDFAIAHEVYLERKKPENPTHDLMQYDRRSAKPKESISSILELETMYTNTIKWCSLWISFLLMFHMKQVSRYQ